MYLRTFLRRLSSQATPNILKKVDPFSKIRIKGNLNYRIQPFDLFECQDGNLLRVSMIDPSKGEMVNQIKVNVNDDTIEVFDSAENATAWCLLEVPIKADLNICGAGDSEILNVHCDILETQCRSLKTRNVNGKEITLQSDAVTCEGLLLGQDISINVDGDLSLHRVQAERLMVNQKNGIFQTNSCYASFSSFNCTNSILRLKNLHKVCQIIGKGKGEVTMNGFYGTLLLEVEDYTLNLQLSELLDSNRIQSKGKDIASINLSEKVLQECFLNIQGNRVALDEVIAEMNLPTAGSPTQISLNSADLTNQLVIEHAGQTVLSKLDWADTFKFSDGLIDLTSRQK